MKKDEIKIGAKNYVKAIVIIFVAVIIFVVAYNIYNEMSYVEVGNIRFKPPGGWTVNYPSGYLVECVAPEQDGSSPNFNIIKGDSYAFSLLVNDSVDSLLAQGVEILYGPRVANVEIAEQAREIIIKYYLEEKGYYARGIQTYIDLGDGGYMIATFTARDDEYDYKSETHYFWALNSMEYKN